MAEKRKARSTNVHQGETEAVEGIDKVNISDLGVSQQKGNWKRGQKEAQLQRSRKI